MLLLAEVSLVAATTGQSGEATASAAAQTAAQQAIDQEPKEQSTPARAPDEASARLSAQAQDRRIEVVGSRTESSTLWANPDGTMSQETHAGPVRFRRNGAWVNIDTTLVKSPDGSVRAKAHPRGLELAGATGGSLAARNAAAAGGDLVTLGIGDQAVSLGWKGTLPQPVLTGHRATYVNALPSVDLVVESTRTGFEQYMVVKDRAAVAQTQSVTLPLRAKGLDVAQKADGSVDFTDSETNKTVGRLPAPVMWDAGTNTQGRQKTRRAPVGLKVVQQGADIELRLSPDKKFLTAPETKYPVTIDPAVYFGLNFDTSVRNGIAQDLSASADLPIGREYGHEEARSFIHFPEHDAFSGKEILNAELNLYSSWSDSCEPRSWEVWDTGLASTATRWANQPAWRRLAATSTETIGHSPACGSQWVQANITQLVSEWAQQDNPSYALGLRATDESDYRSYKIFASGDAAANGPSMLVTYQVPEDPTRDHVEYWNDVLLETYRTVGGPPGPLARAGAMLHGAVYDAANSVKCAESTAMCLGPQYLIKVPATSVLPDVNSAIDHAAFDILRTVYPGLNFDDEIATARSSIPAAVTAAQRAEGSSFGQRAAKAMIDARAGDGATNATPYTLSNTPGSWRPTGSGDAANPNWGLVKPFAMTSGSQFRPSLPAGYSSMSSLLASSQYAAQVNEVKNAGRFDAGVGSRTKDQTDAAFFWANDLNETYKPPGQLFEHTQILSQQHGLSVSGNAKLFALTAFAMADASIVAWDTKYQSSVDLWRPESAIKLDDGNPSTVQDVNWRPLSQDRQGTPFSPNFPAYTSGHATFAGAWAQVMRYWFYTDNVTWTATTDDPHAVGLKRTFTSFSAAAQENARSRIWLGVHYTFDGEKGLTSGGLAAEYVTANRIQPNQAADWVKFEDLKNAAGCEAQGRKLVAEHRWATYQCVRVSNANTDHVLNVK
jgi:hypothetical protein